MKSFDDNGLRESCTKFKTIFSHNNLLDVDANEIFSEMKVLQMNLPNVLMLALEIRPGLEQGSEEHLPRTYVKKKKFPYEKRTYDWDKKKLARE